MGGGERGVVDFGKLFTETNEQKFSLDFSVLTIGAIGPALRRFVTRTAVSYRIVYSLNNNDLFNGLVSWYQKNIVLF